MRVLSRCGISVGVPECPVSGWSVFATSAALHLLSRSASPCFPSDGIARFYLASNCQLFVRHGMRNEEFFMQTEWQCLLLFGAEEEEDDGCFFGMPHWQFNDWTVADGMELAAILHLHPVSTNINTDNLIHRSTTDIFPCLCTVRFIWREQ